MTKEQYLRRLFVVYNLGLLPIFVTMDALAAWGVGVLLNSGVNVLALALSKRWKRD